MAASLALTSAAPPSLQSASASTVPLSAAAWEPLSAAAWEPSAAAWELSFASSASSRSSPPASSDSPPSSSSSSSPGASAAPCSWSESSSSARPFRVDAFCSPAAGAAPTSPSAPPATAESDGPAAAAGSGRRLPTDAAISRADISWMEVEAMQSPPWSPPRIFITIRPALFNIAFCQGRSAMRLTLPCCVTRTSAQFVDARWAQQSLSPCAIVIAGMPFPGRNPLNRSSGTFFAMPLAVTSTTT
mmetsp:Transcript_98568/g.278754  ORF Transcript_98568/g.278754 Transcript_98568/m.278754 type:complete len:245 (-) Transcript_98568:1038-1772(-)